MHKLPSILQAILLVALLVGAVIFFATIGAIAGVLVSLIGGVLLIYLVLHRREPPNRP